MATGSVIDAVSAGYEIEKLESEVIHFMQLSMEEMQKSEALSKELALTKQQKEDFERQFQQLQVELDQAKVCAQQDETSSDRLQHTVATLNAKIQDLRIKGQQHDNDLEELRETVDQRTNTIKGLEARLGDAKTELAQKLDKMTKELKTQESSNETLHQALREAQEQRDTMHISNTCTKAMLIETDQTVNTLCDIIKKQSFELDDVKKSATEQTWKLQQDVDTKEEELKTLRTDKVILSSENAELKQDLEHSKRQTLVASQTGGITIVRLEQENRTLQRELEAKRERLQQEKVVGELTQQVQQHDRRRVRTVAICVDLSGSVSSSGLTGGVKRFYAHLLKHIKKATCKTYVMTVVHGPGHKARVKSEFGSAWAAHENALMCEQTAGSETYVACLRKIKEATLSTGLFPADLQIILIGDGHAYGDQSTDTQSLCQDFSSSDPPVSIHSVVVQQGTATDKLKAAHGCVGYGSVWHTWDYSTRTKGNSMYWGHEGSLPDLGGLLH